MATPPALGLNVITVTSAATGVAPTALAAAIATLQAAVVASREHAVGAVAVVGALVGTTAGATTVARPHPSVGPPFIAAGTRTPLAPPQALAAPWPL
jgi:hypothetical protein